MVNASADVSQFTEVLGLFLLSPGKITMEKRLVLRSWWDLGNFSVTKVLCGLVNLAIPVQEYTIASRGREHDLIRYNTACITGWDWVTFRHSVSDFLTFYLIASELVASGSSVVQFVVHIVPVVLSPKFDNLNSIPVHTIAVKNFSSALPNFLNAKADSVP